MFMRPCAHYTHQRFGSGSGSGSGSGGSGTFWMEAEAESIFENHLEVEAEVEALVKKIGSGKKFGWKRKQFFFLLETKAEAF